MRNRKKKNFYLSLFVMIAFLLITYQNEIKEFCISPFGSLESSYQEKSYHFSEIPEYQGDAYVVLDNDVPNFDESLFLEESFESYSSFDSLNRNGVAFANLGFDLMPTEKRGSIGMIKPSGWNQAKYDFVDGKYLYNRCHLIGYQLSGENDNEKNLITCTRQLNTGTMLEIENVVAAYIKETKNHVLYRVTPIFKEDELLARGVQIEAYSVEDHGKSIQLNRFLYNVQDGITIDYKTGASKANR